MNAWLSARQQAQSVGFVPTMGALHEGHLSLIDRAKKENDLAVCSIFINPTQFNDPADLAKYPRTVEQDLHLLLQRQCDVVFLPEVQDIYSDPASQQRTYDLGTLDARWEGANRPGHFQGVCMVVQRLLEIIPSHRLYLGQKDFQQFLIIQHMVSNLLHGPIAVIPCPIVREPDGLAMSSRNLRLTPQERSESRVIAEALHLIQRSIPAISFDEALAKGRLHLQSASTLQHIDYLALINAEDLSPVAHYEAAKTILAIAAVQFPSARLIDNIVVKGQLGI